MQVAPGVYDEVALRGLDLVLARAHVHGVRLVLPLANRWDAYGGQRQYVAWAGLRIRARATRASSPIARSSSTSGRTCPRCSTA